MASVAASGTHDEEPPADGSVVHALEHGSVVLWHRSGDDSARQRLGALADRYPDDVLVVPREDLPASAVATAWHKPLLCGDPSDPALGTFIAEFRGDGPEKVP